MAARSDAPAPRLAGLLALAATAGCASSTSEDAAGVTWEVAIAAIADPAQCPRYGGLVITPQTGLVPLGRDPASGLWEFAHLASGEPPARRDDGTLELRPQSGIVLVLIPGGTFWKGAQSRDRSAPNYDPAATDLEQPVRDLRLAPYFLSKYETTVAQWRRMTGTGVTAARPGPEDLRPVHGVSWRACRDALESVGLELPTSAQWEYAARGGTTTRWWTGDASETLLGAANLRDAAFAGLFESAEHEPWDDGFSDHAPVGSFRANPFGLHDVHGNVFEWCRDLTDGGHRVLRGGGSHVLAIHARVSVEWSREPGFTGHHLGVRAARLLGN